MSEGGRNGSSFAAHVKGHVGNAWIVFAAVGVNFTDPKAPHGASKYRGSAAWVHQRGRRCVHHPGSLPAALMSATDCSSPDIHKRR